MGHVYIPYCDCDDCLNGSGGLVLPGAGAVTKEALSGKEVREHEREQEHRYYLTARERRRRAA